MNIITPQTPRRHKLTLEDIEELQQDLILAAEVLFGRKLTSATKYRFRTWQHAMYNYDCSGWGSFKTYSAALYAATHIALFEGWTHGIVGLIGRTSKRHFEEVEKLYYQCPVFRGRMAKAPTHEADGFKLVALGGGYILTLPADMAKLGQRIENESFNSATIEEFTRLKTTSVIDIVDSRCRKPNPEYAKYSCNKVIYLGSAEAADSEVYRNRVEKAIKQVIAGNKRYSYTSVNVELLYKIPDCRPYINIDIFEEQQRVMHPTRFDQKWRGKFKSGTGDIYPATIYEANSPIEIVNDRALKGEKYILSYDVAMTTDRFAMKAIKVGDGDPNGVVKYGYSFRCPEAEKKAEYLCKRVYDDYDRFRPAGIVIDASGPGWWLIDALYTYAKAHELEPLVVWNGEREGRRIIYPFESNNVLVEMAIGRYERDRNEYIIEGDDHLKNVSHEALVAAFAHNKITFASDLHLCSDMVVKELSKNEYARIENLQDAVLENFDTTKTQARDLQYEKDREGNIKVTAKGYYVIKGYRDDDIQSLVHCWTGVLIYSIRNKPRGNDKPAESGFEIMAVEHDLDGMPVDAFYPN